MSSLLEMLTGQLAGGALGQISKQLGADEETTGNAVSAALPVLLGALAKNSSNANGAGALLGALSKDHDGSVLDNLAGFLGKPDERMGEGILGHVLGGRRNHVERNVGKASGLNAAGVTRLMTMLAPLVMGALGRTQRQRKLDAGGLSDLLASEQTNLQRQNPQLGGLAKRKRCNRSARRNESRVDQGEQTHPICSWSRVKC